ncbi:hypothetical protein E2562_038091 [Oryza meyeriana var. granulata]|uniref:Uncharacterized protein n=1 Tax=Oryza meyeriana var. granulata TaxID=110450 RepID=A0A6G1CBR8_9ORYZ|nr:hypothetical protein E2562_038091 [Oryza meyeriana var. granulata]
MVAWCVAKQARPRRRLGGRVARARPKGDEPPRSRLRGRGSSLVRGQPCGLAGPGARVRRRPGRDGKRLAYRA